MLRIVLTGCAIRSFYESTLILQVFFIESYAGHSSPLSEEWRCVAELHRSKRFCRPLPNCSANAPRRRSRLQLTNPRLGVGFFSFLLLLLCLVGPWGNKNLLGIEDNRVSSNSSLRIPAGVGLLQLTFVPPLPYRPGVQASSVWGDKGDSTDTLIQRTLMYYIESLSNVKLFSTNTRSLRILWKLPYKLLAEHVV